MSTTTKGGYAKTELAPTAPDGKDITTSQIDALAAEVAALKAENAVLKSAPVDEPRPKVATAGGELPPDPQELEVKLIAAAERRVNLIEDVRSHHYRMIWRNVPPQYSSWIFYRCGVLSDEKARKRAEEVQEFGFVKAPRGVYPVGFESDGELGLYMMAPAQVGAIMNRAEAEAQRKWRDTFFGRFPRDAVQQAADRLRDLAPRSQFTPIIHTSEGGVGSVDADFKHLERALG